MITKDAVKEISDSSGLSVNLLINAGEFDVIMGGNQLNLSWKEYLEGWKEKYHPHIKLLKKFIIENGMVGATGKEQNHWSFKFSDDVHLGFTWRAWGDFMQAIVNKKEGYMRYYM